MHTIVTLDKNHRIYENSYGVFLQKRQILGKHVKSRSWKTLKMFSDLKEAFVAWEQQDY